MMASDGNVDYFPFRTALHRFRCRDVQEEEVISTISYLSGGSGPRWDDIRVETFKLIKSIFENLWSYEIEFKKRNLSVKIKKV